MERKMRTRWLAPALGIGALALAILVGSTPSVGASPGPSPVAVVNTPLPVQGTVTANQGGTWTVGIDGTPSVQVASTASRGFRFRYNPFDGDTENVFQNELGETIVIENIAASDSDGFFELLTYNDPLGPKNYYHFVGKQVSDGSYRYNELAKIYVRPGEFLKVLAPGAYTVTLSGQHQPAQ